MNEFDHRTLRLIARERQELLRREVELSRSPRPGRLRAHLGGWIVGLGVRVAGRSVERGSLSAPPQPG